MVLGVPLSSAMVPVPRAGFTCELVNFWKARKGKGISHQDSAGSSVSIKRVKGEQGHNLAGYYRKKIWKSLRMKHSYWTCNGRPEDKNTVLGEAGRCFK